MSDDFISGEKTLQIDLNIKVDAVPARSSRAVLKACETGAEDGVDAYADYIRSIPAADVVKVVRCIDCRYCTEDKEMPCCEIWNTANMPEDGFCFMGERRKK